MPLFLLPLLLCLQQQYDVHQSKTSDLLFLILCHNAGKVSFAIFLGFRPLLWRQCPEKIGNIQKTGYLLLNEYEIA